VKRFNRLRQPSPSGSKPEATQEEFLGVAFQLDEQLRRYQDLARRAGDLRSYL
jgi:hypothetical protein